MNTFTKEELISLLAAQEAKIDSLNNIIEDLDYQVEDLEMGIETYKGFVKEDAAIIKGLQAA